MYRLYMCTSLYLLKLFLHLQAIHKINEALAQSLAQTFPALNDGSDSGYASLIISVHMEIDADLKLEMKGSYFSFTAYKT